MNKNEQLELITKAKIAFQLMSSVHIGLCRLNERGNAVVEECREICMKIIHLRERLGEFDNDGE